MNFAADQSDSLCGASTYVYDVSLKNEAHQMLSLYDLRPSQQIKMKNRLFNLNNKYQQIIKYPKISIINMLDISDD